MDFSHLVSLFPVFLFLLILLYISYRVQRTSEEARSKNFAKDYFIGGRTLGGFVLAMTTVATYSSVSTFVGGPGVAWQIGYGWLHGHRAGRRRVPRHGRLRQEDLPRRAGH